MDSARPLPCRLVATIALALLAACASDQVLAEVIHDRPSDEDASGPGAIVLPPLMVGCNPCSDFPPDPIIDASNGSMVPPDVIRLFSSDAGPGTLPGPCLVEPQLGSLLPRNWLRPRFRLIPGADQKVFEIRLHADIEKNDLVVYTSATTWTLPKDIWTALAANAADQPITISVRGIDPGAAAPRPSLPSIGSITIAPTEAKGNIVYWSATQGSLKGFAVGDEVVGAILRPAQVRGKCVACHTSTPDGRFMAVTVSTDVRDGAPVHIELRTPDGKAAEREVTPSVTALLARLGQHFPIFTRGHWSPGDRVMITTYQRGLMWTDLEAQSEARGTAWDMLTFSGDPNQYATHPNWSHDGSTIVYTSMAQPGVSVAEGTGADLYVVPFGARRGGAASPLPGASSPHINEYYPAFSPDDRYIAFTRALGPYDPQSPDLLGTPGNIDSNPVAEIFVIPKAGGAAQRLAANDPPTCSGIRSPGLSNSWTSWSAQAQTINGKTYYWLTFSSRRIKPDVPQLYVSGMVIDSIGQIQSYPALYLWNQPEAEHNHTPVWDAFELPFPPIN